MQMIKSLLITSLVMLPILPAWGWNVSVTVDNQVVVSNTTEMEAASDIYLVYYTPDAADSAEQYASWTQSSGWQTASDKPLPAFSQPLRVEKLQRTVLTELPATCDSEQRCFLVLVAVEPGKDPLVVSNWQKSSLLPLSVAASHERLPGQAFFLPRINQNEERFTVDTPSMAPPEAAPAAAAEDLATDEGADTSGSGTPTETEKPDIFKLVGNQLLYANGAAEKFQVIDVSDVADPKLIGETQMQGSPRELYTINGYHVLMQTHHQDTIITVLELNAAESMQVVSETTLSGYFMESRRRNEVIYAVTDTAIFAPTPFADEQCFLPEGCGTWQGMTVTALQVGSTGQVTQTGSAELNGYGPRIAIFADYLLMASDNPQQWNLTDIQAFDLSSATSPLVKLPTLTVPGRVRSEFHMHMRDDLLHVAYGPENRQDGSTLAIFKLSTDAAVLQGQVDKIAPGEDLYATRFAGDKAYMVTYERVDPLWVVDISNPTAPTILGELKVPGWSEKMFFNDDQLFAVGFHDQPEPNEPAELRVRRVAMSLFDVSDPTQPDILDRFIPLVDEAQWSHSPAVYDERALLLDWQNRYAALPINAWEVGSGTHLQVVTFANDRFVDAGIVESPVNLQRSLPIADNVLAGLGDQALMTLQWGNGKAEVLAELELAINLAWLDYQKGAVWAGSRGNNGFYRFYQYAANDVDTPIASWNLSKSFDNITMDNRAAVFYDSNPLSVQLLDLNTGVLSGVMNLEATTLEPEPILLEDEEAAESSVHSSRPSIWYNRSQPVINGSWFYVAEQRPMEYQLHTLPFILPEVYGYNQTQWLLRGWDLSTQGEVTVEYSIPGTPIGFNAEGHLITRENDGGKMRMNLVSLANDSANLLSTQQYPCDYYQTQVYWAEALYMHCYPARPQQVIDQPIPVEPEPQPVDVVPLPEPEFTLRDALEASRLTDEPFPDNVMPESQAYTLKIAVGQSFVQQGTWEWETQHSLIQASQDTVAMQPNDYWWYDYPMMDAAIDIWPDAQSQCGIYALQAGQNPTLLTELEYCPWGNHFAIGDNQAWRAKGFAGIEVVTW